MKQVEVSGRGRVAKFKERSPVSLRMVFVDPAAPQSIRRLVIVCTEKQAREIEAFYGITCMGAEA